VSRAAGAGPRTAGQQAKGPPGRPPGPGDRAALDLAHFAALMDRLGPYEPDAHLAVAVSGGADSLALAVLLRDWARARGFLATALVVDHGLRDRSAAEARAVVRSLAAQGLAARVLRARGPKPRANVQAAARAMRYRLLADWCARRGVLHLALAHHRDDQAETLLLRLGRGSGLDGLAGMAPVVELRELRLLRPLLEVPKAALEATLTARGLSWLEDPSNRDRAHRRVRMRQLADLLAGEGLSAARLAATAAHLGRARAALEAAVADLLAGAARPDPAGFLWLDPQPLAGAPREVRLRALARCLMMVGGGGYTPRLSSLMRLEARILAGLRRGATLGGCRIVPLKGRLLLVREAAAAPSLEVAPGQGLFWDDRFEIRLRRPRTGRRARNLTVGPLGSAGWRALAKGIAPGLRGPLPAAAGPSIPALFDARGVLEAPLIGYRRSAKGSNLLQCCRFSPQNSLTTARFTVA
jgi:tRNA(Ile)-lysidine synthase